MNPVKQAIQELNAHLDGHLRLAVAWSGGLDSTVLLHAFKTAGLSVHALHVNHGLQIAAQDFEKFCFETAQQFAVPLEIIRLQGEQACGSLETWAREKRYQAMFAWMTENQIDHLALAHHADDQIETTLLQLLRGSGLRGVGGMSALAPAGAARQEFPDIKLLRPFLGLSKADLLSYANEHQLQYVEDPTNDSIDHKRNWVRLNLLPDMREHFPQTDQAILRLAEFVHSHHESLDAVVQDLLGSVLHDSGLLLHRWRHLSKPSQMETLRLWLLQQGVRCGRDKLIELHRQLLNEGGGLRQVAGQWAIMVKKSVATVSFIREDNDK